MPTRLQLSGRTESNTASVVVAEEIEDVIGALNTAGVDLVRFTKDSINEGDAIYVNRRHVLHVEARSGRGSRASFS